MASGATKEIRYRLTIDKKPEIYKSNLNMYSKKNEKGIIVEYMFAETAPEGYEWECGPAPEWREEMYRNALEQSILGSSYSIYDAELLAEWRKLFDPN